MKANSTTNLRVYTVWVPFLGANRDSAKFSARILPDPRVVQFWDNDALTSKWFGSNVVHSSLPAWDVYFLYGAGAKWSDVPKPLVSSGGTIIGKASDLQTAITPLLRPPSSATG